MALAPAQDVILLFGDSLTQHSWGRSGIAQKLAAAYVRKLDVINRGLSGYQTDWAIPVFEQTLAKTDAQRDAPKVQLLTIWFGANDAVLPPGLQHVPRDRFKTNLIHLVDMVKSPRSEYHSPDTRIILITPPPVNTYQLSSPTRVFEVTKVYAETVKEVGAEVDVPVADVWTGLWEAAGRDERALDKFLYDGLHLNAEGYDIVFNAVTRVIKEKYPEMYHDALQMVFPPWGDTAKGPL